ncbi:hypothetical protein V8E53_014399 [Lactarius tabidus]
MSTPLVCWALCVRKVGGGVNEFPCFGANSGNYGEGEAFSEGKTGGWQWQWRRRDGSLIPVCMRERLVKNALAMGRVSSIRKRPLRGDSPNFNSSCLGSDLVIGNNAQTFQRWKWRNEVARLRQLEPHLAARFCPCPRPSFSYDCTTDLAQVPKWNVPNEIDVAGKTGRDSTLLLLESPRCRRWGIAVEFKTAFYLHGTFLISACQESIMSKATRALVIQRIGGRRQQLLTSQPVEGR